MKYARMAIEKESPEELGYDRIRHNLSESSIADRTLAEIGANLDDLVLFYGDHRGDPALRAAIAAQGPGLSPDDALVTAGAAGALFIVATSLLGPDDHLVVVRPNYATNIETPRAIGCAISYVDLVFENGFALDVDAIAAAVRPNTRYVSVTTPHNPTGVVIAPADMARLAALAEARRIHLLVDETYRDLTVGEPAPSAAAMSERVIAVSSLSKAYGAPGVRIGWIVTRDRALRERFLAAKEQIVICGSVVDECIGLAILKDRDAFLRRLRPLIAARLAIMREWIAGEPLVEWVEPKGGVVCFPRMKVPASYDFDGFHRRLLERHGAYVGPGHWFEMSRAHFRVGFAWPREPALRAGLAAISTCLREGLPGA